MIALLVAIGVLFLGGGAALAAGRSPRWCTGLAVGAVLVASLIALVPAVAVLLGDPAQSLRLAWEIPYGAFFVEIDALSAFFLLAIFVLAAASAVWGSAYLLEHHGEKSLGPPWFFFNLLVASMALVVIARNAMLFLIAWEVMALASFFLVTFDDGDERVRDAGWTYLVATHLGTAFLLVLFVVLGRQGESLDFDRFVAPPAGASLLFLLAVIGFGTKAGFVPFHVWLPEAHPAAPSHVSAVMSGVMIKTGIYGLVRVLTFLGPPPAWWGWLLMAIGLVSAIYGVLFALAQHDLKRLLAYHSIENIGIIALALGIGLVGLSAGAPALAVLGFAGGLLHVLNHAIFKGLLFLGAGTVVHATGTHEIDSLGGLLARMPWTGASFLTGAVAIAGLPPLNGFISEWLIYLGAFQAVTSGNASTGAPALAAIAGLALIGGLAAACFTKVFGIVFLGEPRSDRAENVRDPGLAMRWPMLLLACACALVGCMAPLLVGALAPLVQSATGLPPETVASNLAFATRPLQLAVAASAGLLVAIAALAGLRRWLLARRPVETRLTWDCGYAAPSARMQYTASSFAQPLTKLFGFLLQTHRRFTPPTGFFPASVATRKFAAYAPISGEVPPLKKGDTGGFVHERHQVREQIPPAPLFQRGDRVRPVRDAGAELVTETADLWSEHFYRPVFRGIGRGLSLARWVQHGRVQLYILYIAITLLVLLVWKLG